MNNWIAYKDGRSMGRVGTESDAILQDDEHKSGARITLKHSGTYISISCNIYGWIEHTRFFSTVPDAQREYTMMKSQVEKMMNTVTSATSDSIKGWKAISEFVRRFP